MLTYLVSVGGPSVSSIHREPRKNMTVFNQEFPVDIAVSKSQPPCYSISTWVNICLRQHTFIRPN